MGLALVGKKRGHGPLVSQTGLAFKFREPAGMADEKEDRLFIALNLPELGVPRSENSVLGPVLGSGAAGLQGKPRFVCKFVSSPAGDGKQCLGVFDFESVPYRVKGTHTHRSRHRASGVRSLRPQPRTSPGTHFGAARAAHSA